MDSADRPALPCDVFPGNFSVNSGPFSVMHGVPEMFPIKTGE